MTLIRRLLAATGVAVVLSLSGAGAALAAPTHAPSIDIGPVHTDCKDAPVPESPYDGMTSWIMHAPTTLPKDEDPFAPGATTTIFQQYGMAGSGLEVYDNGSPVAGCMSMDSGGTGVANYLNLGVKMGLAANTALGNQVLYPTFLKPMDPALTAITQSIQRSFTSKVLPLTILIAAIITGLALRAARIGFVLSALFVVLLCVTLVSAAVNFPVQVGHAADNTVSSLAVTGVAAATDTPVTDVADIKAAPATLLNSGFYKTVVYDPWLRNTLGSSTSATAVKYGPRLWKSHALTWREGAVVQKDPAGKGKALVEQKQQDWKDVAGEIQKTDPVAYRFLQGKNPGDRMGTAAVSSIITLIGLWFLYWSYIMLLFCYLVFRMSVVIAPLVLPLVVIPKFHGALRSMRDLLGAAVVNSVIYITAGGLLLAIANTMFASTMDSFMAVLVFMTLSAAAWLFLAPFRSLTSMASADPIGGAMDARKQAASRTKRLMGKAAATYAGVRIAEAGASKREERREHEREEQDYPTRNVRSVRPVIQYARGGQESYTFPEPMPLPVGDAGEVYQVSDIPQPVQVPRRGSIPLGTQGAPLTALPAGAPARAAQAPAQAPVQVDGDTTPTRVLPGVEARAEAQMVAEQDGGIRTAAGATQYQPGEDAIDPAAVTTPADENHRAHWAAVPPATVGANGEPVWMVYDAQTGAFVQGSEASADAGAEAGL